MERLTKRDTDGQAMMDCEKCEADWTGKHGKPMADCTALYCRNRLLDRLVKYEDTELTPEEVLPKDKADEIALKLMRFSDLENFCNYTRLRELAEADKDGRLVVLGHPRRRVMWGDVEPDRLLCPECGNDLAGGFPEQASANLETVNCPYCGEYLNLGRKTETVKHWRR